MRAARVGFICNLLVRPVDPKHHMTDAELEAERKRAHEAATRNAVGGLSAASARPTSPVTAWLAWLAVGIPLAWGVYITLKSAAVLFR